MKCATELKKRKVTIEDLNNYKDPVITAPLTEL
jgi:hypothetical protein